MVLAPHLRMVVWSHKFWPHLPKKYDRMVNPPPPRGPANLLHLHPRCRGDEAIMANYFPIALTGSTRSWLMNLPEGTLGF
jgi:hypothetical protein